MATIAEQHRSGEIGLLPSEQLATTVRGLIQLESLFLTPGLPDQRSAFVRSPENAATFTHLIQDFETFSAQMGLPQVDTWRAAKSHAILFAKDTHEDTALGIEAHNAVTRFTELLRPFLTPEELKVERTSEMRVSMMHIDITTDSPAVWINSENDVRELLADFDSVTRAATTLGMANQNLYLQLVVKLKMIIKGNLIAAKSPLAQRRLQLYELLAFPRRNKPFPVTPQTNFE